MRTTLLMCLAVCFSLIGAESPRALPLWDGKETVESYAARVGMPAAKSVDLGGGIKLELMLIPAGEFVMGSAAPEKPAVTVYESVWVFWIGGGVAGLLLLILLGKYAVTKKFSFSLRGLLLMTIATGACVGGFARVKLVAEKQEARYEREMVEFNKLPANEKPAHLVTLTQPFYMGKYTVTQAQYKALMVVNPSFAKGPQLPVENVTWDAAIDFCKKLNRKLRPQGLEARLPSEAQWEYACRAGTRTRFYSGDKDSDMDEVGWSRNNSASAAYPVGLKKPNAFGLHDMHGSIFQWCQDSYVDHYESLKTADPVNENGADRIMRGGCRANPPEECRSACRGASDPKEHNFYHGFRVVAVPRSTAP